MPGTQSGTSKEMLLIFSMSQLRPRMMRLMTLPTMVSTVFSAPLTMPFSPESIFSMSRLIRPSRKVTSPENVCLRFPISCSPLPARVVMAKRMAAMPATTSGNTFPVRNQKPRPVLTIPAIIKSVFLRFRPFWSMSRNAVTTIAAPATISPMPAPSSPKVR